MKRKGSKGWTTLKRKPAQAVRHNPCCFPNLRHSGFTRVGLTVRQGYALVGRTAASLHLVSMVIAHGLKSGACRPPDASLPKNFNLTPYHYPKHQGAACQQALLHVFFPFFDAETHSPHLGPFDHCSRLRRTWSSGRPCVAGTLNPAFKISIQSRSI